MMRDTIKGLTFFSLFAAACWTSCVVLFPTILLLPIPSERIIALRRKIINFYTGTLIDFSAILLTTLCGTKVSLYSDNPNILNEKPLLIISNHRTRVDWMFSGWCYCKMLNVNSRLVVMLKEELKSVPIFGWAMQLCMYIFLHRKREIDVPHIKKMLDYSIASTDTKPTILLFPEGTDLSPTMVEKSNTFAREHNLKEMQYVLQPKSAGMAACMSSLQGHDGYLHDITIAYRDFHVGERSNDVAFVLKGEFPQEVHLIVKSYKIDDIPTEKIEMEKWLRSIFTAKEELLKTFYENNSFPPSDKKSKKWPYKIQYKNNNTKTIIFVLSIVFIIFISLYFYSWFRWLCTLMIVVYVGAKAGDGFDNIELSIHGDMFAKKN